MRFLMILLLSLTFVLKVDTTVVFAESFDELTATSDLIVSGKVKNVEEKDFIFDIEDTLYSNKGDALSNETIKIARFRKFSCTEDIFLPQASGEEAILFLKKSNDISNKNSWVVNGFIPGYYPVVDGLLLFDERGFPSAEMEIKQLIKDQEENEKEFKKSLEKLRELSPTSNFDESISEFEPIKEVTATYRFKKEDFINAIRAYRTIFKIKPGSLGVNLEVIADQEAIDSYKSLSDAHKFLVNETFRRMERKTYRYVDDKVLVLLNGNSILEVPLKKSTKSGLYAYEGDTAYFVADLLVIVRGAKLENDIYSGESVEIYPFSSTNKGPIKIKDRDLAGALHGSFFSSPSRDWGLIAQDNFGKYELLGFTHFGSDGTYQRHVLEQPCKWKDYGRAKYNQSSEIEIYCTNIFRDLDFFHVYPNPKMEQLIKNGILEKVGSSNVRINSKAVLNQDEIRSIVQDEFDHVWPLLEQAQRDNEIFQQYTPGKNQVIALIIDSKGNYVYRVVEENDPKKKELFYN